MGREQGDELGNEVVYVREVDGKQQERRAYSPADEVNLAARGWVRRDENQSQAQSPQRRQSPASGPAANPAGESA